MVPSPREIHSVGRGGAPAVNSELHLTPIRIIGEAASRISDETKAKRPDISWTEIDGMRSRFVNACFAIRFDALWQTVQDGLPPLIAQLEPLVPPESE